MAERTLTRRYGLAYGAVAGLFAVLQVFVMVASARAGASGIATLQQSLASSAADVYVIGPLLPMLVATYLAAIITGAITIAICAVAGRFVAEITGSYPAGAAAGGWVAATSAAIWIALSVIAVVIYHADGTISGIFTANPTGPMNPAELIGLLVQEIIAAVLGFGLGSLAGQRGATRALRFLRLPRTRDPRMPPPLARDDPATHPTPQS